MPFDAGKSKPEKESNSFGEKRIYVCETGDVRIETEHFRREFAPEDFINLLREIVFKDKEELEKCLKKDLVFYCWRY